MIPELDTGTSLVPQVCSCAVRAGRDTLAPIGLWLPRQAPAVLRRVAQAAPAVYHKTLMYNQGRQTLGTGERRICCTLDRHEQPGWDCGTQPGWRFYVTQMFLGD